MAMYSMYTPSSAGAYMCRFPFIFPITWVTSQVGIAARLSMYICLKVLGLWGACTNVSESTWYMKSVLL